jgi:hypothetical protein
MDNTAPRGRKPRNAGATPTIVLALVALAALIVSSAAQAEKWYVCGFGNCVPSPAYCPGHDKRSWGSCLPPVTQAVQRVRKPHR